MAESPAAAPPETVEAFHFGDPELFGCLHHGVDRRHGVVLCHPFGHEYIVLHRAVRILATRIARAAAPVLRFDYSGTGDSAGRLTDARLDRWVADIEAAIEVLRARTGVERVSLVGVRLGADLALEAASRRDDVESLALWDPVIWGRSYLRELRRDHRRMLRIAHVVPGPPDATATERLGFHLAGPLVEDLRRLESDATRPPRVARILLLETRPADAAPLGAALRAAGCDVDSRCDARPDLWRWSEDITRLQLPHSQVRTVARWIAGEDG